jgi:hypothetical protein
VSGEKDRNVLPENSKQLYKATDADARTSLWIEKKRLLDRKERRRKWKPREQDNKTRR